MQIKHIALVLALLQVHSRAENWAHFRGSDGSGHGEAVNVPAAFTEKDYRWIAELPGRGTSSPVCWRQKLFLTAESGGDGHRNLLCYDAISGSLEWKFADSFSSYSKHDFNNYASSTPAVDARHVYVSRVSGTELKVLAVTHEGQKVWDRSLGEFKEAHGHGASPVVAGSFLVVSKDYAGEDAFIAGLNTSTGEVEWKLKRASERTAFSTPIVIKERDPKGAEASEWSVIFSSNPDALTCINAATGAIRWEWKFTNSADLRAVASPVLAGDVFFATAGKGGAGRVCAAVRVKDAKPEEAWELDKNLPYVPTSLFADGLMYLLADDGILTCLSAKTGKQVYKERVHINAYSSPVLVDGKLFCISRKGDVKTIKPGEKFEVLGESHFGESCEATPAAGNGMIYFRTASHLIALGGSKEKKSAHYQGIGVAVDLVCETKSFTPGQPIPVALLLKPEPGHHTYWKNPGLAGMPLTIDWHLPEGFRPGEIQWPPPDRVNMRTIMAHGYKKESFLMVEITPPANLPESVTQLDVSANLAWMCCGQLCNPGYCEISLMLPRAAAGAKPELNAQSQERFSNARSALPPPAHGWKFAAHRSGKNIVLEGVATEPSAVVPSQHQARFFSNDNLICSHPDQEWTWNDHGFAAKLPLSEFPPSDQSMLRGLLFAPASWQSGTPHNYVEISVAISEEKN